MIDLLDSNLISSSVLGEANGVASSAARGGRWRQTRPSEAGAASDPRRRADALKAVPDASTSAERRSDRSHAAARAGASPRAHSLASSRAQRQRLRLALAMIECVGEDGYRSTRVADVIAQAGVSRKTFYEQFDNKQDCLLATYDLIAEPRAMRRVEEAYRDASGWPGRVETAIRALFDAATANPGALQLSLIEIAAVGPAGIERRARTREHYEAFIRDALELAPGKGAVADVTLKAIVGGLNRVLYARVAARTRRSCARSVPTMTDWATSYYPTPARMRGRARAALAEQRATIRVQGGRAPGTLAPHPLMRRSARPRARGPEHLAQLRGAEPARADPRRGDEPDRAQRAMRR